MTNQEDTLFYRQQVEAILQQLKMGLGPYVLAAYRDISTDPIATINKTLAKTGIPRGVSQAANDDTSILEELDTQKLLKLMRLDWDTVFKKRRLEDLEHAYVYELTGYRNLWAHELPMGEDDAYRVSDTARRLLLQLGEPNYANAVWKLGDEIFQRKRTSRRSGPIRVKLEGNLFERDSLAQIYELVLVSLYQGKYIHNMSLPFATSHKRYLFNDQPLHPTGEPFRVPVEYKGYYLEAHKGREIGLKHLQKLLETCDLSLQIISF